MPEFDWEQLRRRDVVRKRGANRSPHVIEEPPKGPAELRDEELGKLLMEFEARYADEINAHFELMFPAASPLLDKRSRDLTEEEDRQLGAAVVIAFDAFVRDKGGAWLALLDDGA